MRAEQTVNEMAQEVLYRRRGPWPSELESRSSRRWRLSLNAWCES
jgi:hypothetical protein